MKRIAQRLLALLLIVAISMPLSVQAAGEGNMESGGGGMGQGSEENKWGPGMDGVRITVVRSDGNIPVTTPIDLTNQNPSGVRLHFGKVCKLSYTGGKSLSPSMSPYTYINPAQALPVIVSTNGVNNIEAIKSYFTDEQIIRSIANLTGMDFETLISGTYKLMVEPLAYYWFQGIMVAATATETALYDQITGGLLRRKMVSLTHKNLPLAIFLEISDLGFPAWAGSRTNPASDADIITALGVGTVKFREQEQEVKDYDYEYRVNTEVITSVMVRGGQSDPDEPVAVTFSIGGKQMQVGNVYYPEGDSQLAWVRWTTPKEPQEMTISVSVSGGGYADQSSIHVNIIDLDQNQPPDPQAEDRYDSFSVSEIPDVEEKLSSSWSIWRPRWEPYWVWHASENEESGGYWCDHGWWEFDCNHFSASMTAAMEISPDETSPTAYVKTMKSGYGITEQVQANVNTSQSSAVTSAQTAVTYFPEFGYTGFWRLLENTNNGYHAVFVFQKNEYSTYGNRTHFTPIWFPDGWYVPFTRVMDCWTPAGMLSQNLTDRIRIQGNLWMDWHIAPQAVE